MKMGYGLDESTRLGPYTTMGGKEKVASWIDKSLRTAPKWSWTDER